MLYKVISTGSKGNCVVINDKIAIDLGVSYRKLGDYKKTIKLVFLTHQHTDHFNWDTVRLLAHNHPTVKFACMDYMVNSLKKIVPPKNIYILKPDTKYDLGICQAAAFDLEHDVPNCGWRLFIEGKKIVYATDTRSLNIEAKDYDYYFIEGNYDYETTLKRYRDKKEKGEYVYELRAMSNHLSIDQFKEFIAKNNVKGEVIMMHQHEDKDEIEEKQSLRPDAESEEDSI